jgi:CheY-like chemotaxis protein
MIMVTTAVKYANVLLVDDNPMDNMVNSQLITQSGFAKKSNCFESAKETLEFLRSADVSELPEIIFLDIIMPGMDGFQFLEEFEKLDASIRTRCRIVLLSSSDSFKDLNRANKNRLVKKFLNKPLTVEMLAAINI